MPEATFPDEWLVVSLDMLTAEQIAAVREKPEPKSTLWESVVVEKLTTDEAILEKLGARFRMKVADITTIDSAVRDKVPEQLARRYRILPLRVTDSYLEVATANPFDLDMEKDLAFATAREVRLLLQSPAKITEQLDVLYRPEKALDKLLEGMGESEMQLLADEAPPEELNIEAAAQERPVVKLVDLII